MTPAANPVPSPPDTAASQPLIFAGPPGQLLSTVSVANTGDRRLVLRTLTVRREGGADVVARAPAVVRPGDTVTVPVSVELEPRTPPGDYAAAVEVSGVSREAVLRVEPHLSVRVRPRRILGVPGSQALTILVSNDSNVAVPLAAVTKAYTDDGGSDPGPDVLLTLDRPETLEPGAAVELAGRLEVPTDLDPARRYRALIPIGVGDLEVLILPRAPEEAST